eukprot:TRINITY_DN11153_c0_g1_i1.p1 TRINITY_DN11153_c0_g1~~TRINITY_DN11153_c0_g1_i1.p1  ORF type:complete len:261 (+),score=59.10 TRINITY_DN11153_c0_g1_i1:52-834(+)
MASKVVMTTKNRSGRILSRNVRSKSGRKMVFGFGNSYYPESRQSVGIRMVNKFADLRGHFWRTSSNEDFDFCESADYVLVRPRKYFIGNCGLSLLSALKTYQLSFAQTVVVMHDIEREFGQMRMFFGGAIGENEDLLKLFSQTRTMKFSRLQIGINRPGWKRRQLEFLPNKMSNQLNKEWDWHCQNKFSYRDEELLNNFIFDPVKDILNNVVDNSHNLESMRAEIGRTTTEMEIEYIKQKLENANLEDTESPLSDQEKIE